MKRILERRSLSNRDDARRAFCDDPACCPQGIFGRQHAVRLTHVRSDDRSRVCIHGVDIDERCAKCAAILSGEPERVIESKIAELEANAQRLATHDEFEPAAVCESQAAGLRSAQALLCAQHPVKVIRDWIAELEQTAGRLAGEARYWRAAERHEEANGLRWALATIEGHDVGSDGWQKLYIFEDIDEEGEMAIVIARTEDEARERVRADCPEMVYDLSRVSEFTGLDGAVYWHPFQR